MENYTSKKPLCLIAIFSMLTACGTTQEKPTIDTANTVTEGTKKDSVSNTNIEGALKYHMSVQSNSDYVLPDENVLIYKQYTMEELIKKSLSGGGIMDNDLFPVFIKTPDYPASAFANKEQGDVFVEFTAPTMGKIKQINIISSPKNPDFKKNILEAFQHWTYAPPKIKNTKYTVTNVKVEIEFRIENDKPVFYFKDDTDTSGIYPKGPIPTLIK